MDFEKIDSIIKNKKKEPTKADKAIFFTEMMSLLEEQGVNDTSMKYMAEGFSICNCSPIYSYIINKPAEDQTQIVNAIFHSSPYKENEKGCAYRMCVSMLSKAVKDNTINVICTLIQLLPTKITNKKKEQLKDLSPVFEKYFINTLDKSNELPKLDDLPIKPVFVDDFRAVVKKILKGIEPGRKTNIEKLEAVTEWVNSKTDDIQVKTDDTSKTETVTPMRDDSNSKAKIPSEEKTDNIQVEAADISKMETAKPSSDDSNSETEIPSNEEKTVVINKNVAVLRKQMDTMFDAFEDLVKLNAFSKQKCNQLLTINKELRGELDNYQKRVIELEKKLTIVNNYLKTAETTAADLSLKARENEKKIAELSDELERVKSINSVFIADKKDSQSEMLKNIATKLKGEYRDFKDAESMEMTINLGENLRDQIIAIFRILKKNGIDIEGE